LHGSTDTSNRPSRRGLGWRNTRFYQHAAAVCSARIHYLTTGKKQIARSASGQAADWTTPQNSAAPIDDDNATQRGCSQIEHRRASPERHSVAVSCGQSPPEYISSRVPSRFQQQSAFLPEIRRYKADAKHHWVKAAQNANGIIMRAGIKDSIGICR